MSISIKKPTLYFNSSQCSFSLHLNTLILSLVTSPRKRDQSLTAAKVKFFRRAIFETLPSSLRGFSLVSIIHVEKIFSNSRRIEPLDDFKDFNRSATRSPKSQSPEIQNPEYITVTQATQVWDELGCSTLYLLKISKSFMCGFPV